MQVGLLFPKIYRNYNKNRTVRCVRTGLSFSVMMRVLTLQWCNLVYQDNLAISQPILGQFRSFKIRFWYPFSQARSNAPHSSIFVVVLVDFWKDWSNLHDPILSFVVTPKGSHPLFGVFFSMSVAEAICLHLTQIEHYLTKF